jgi:hypothetical protein
MAAEAMAVVEMVEVVWAVEKAAVAMEGAVRVAAAMVAAMLSSRGCESGGDGDGGLGGCDGGGGEGGLEGGGGEGGGNGGGGEGGGEGGVGLGGGLGGVGAPPLILQLALVPRSELPVAEP